MRIEYKEDVLGKTSTHYDIKSTIQEKDLVVVGDLVIITNNKDDKEVIEILADSRYYFASVFNLSAKDFEEEPDITELKTSYKK